MKAKKMFIQLVLFTSMALLSACTSMTNPKMSDISRADLAKEASRSLELLYATTPEAKELGARAKAVLVFPDIFRLGLLVGGSGGNGVMFSPEGRVLGYYNATSFSYGLQAGAQDYSEALFLMTDKAFESLDGSGSWSVGVGPSVVFADKGVAKDYSTTTLRSDVYAFVYGQSGLMAGLGLQGQKITRLQQ